MDDNRVIGNIESIQSGSELAIKANDSPFAESFYFCDYYDEKATKRFIKTVEKLIRTSREYHTYIELLRTNCQQLNRDNVLSNITTGDVDLEFHHYPFSLYDIIETIMMSYIIRNIKFTSYSLARDVMKEHYKHHIGLVSLTHTTHELAHSGNLFISSRQVFGNYHAFMADYADGMSADMSQKIKTMEDLTQQGIPSDIAGVLCQK